MVEIQEHHVRRAILIASSAQVFLWLLVLLNALVAGALKHFDAFAAGVMLTILFSIGGLALGVMCAMYRNKELRVFFIGGQLLIVLMHIWCIVLYSVFDSVSHSGGQISNISALKAAAAFIVISLIVNCFDAAAGIYFWKKDFDSEVLLQEEIEESQTLL